MSDAPAHRGPIFIVGPMGSGTTLLRLMLDSHPHMARQAAVEVARRLPVGAREKLQR